MVQSNIWISNKGMLIMVTIHGNRYRSMFCLYMMFLKKAGHKVLCKHGSRWQEHLINDCITVLSIKILHALVWAKENHENSEVGYDGFLYCD